MPSFDIMIPVSSVAPSKSVIHVMSSTGVIRSGLTNTFVYSTSPTCLQVTNTGGTLVAVGDVITIMGMV
jgi:hypothetical protein